MFGSTNCILWLVVFGIGKQLLLVGRFQNGQDFFMGSVENSGRAGHPGGQAVRRPRGEVTRRRGGEAGGGQAARRPDA